MKKATVLFIGGFLGAGKTSLMKRAVERLAVGGRRVGVITKDQAAGMVDTRVFELAGIPVREVSGSCFCCNFPALIRAMDSLRGEEGVEIILAESVGSCTDLSATILQPLKAGFADRYETRPLSVAVDPQRLRDAFPTLPADASNSNEEKIRLHGSAAYIVRKQLEEADIILVNKTDRLDDSAREAATSLLTDKYPHVPVMPLSALTGEGVEAWLLLAMREKSSGNRLAEVDYDIYAEGEAVLGWLNVSMKLTAKNRIVDWKKFFQALIGGLGRRFRSRGQNIGHLKLLLSAGEEYLAGNLIRAGGQPSLRGGISSRPSRAELLINARVETNPARLKELVLTELRGLYELYGLEPEPLAMHCFSPGRPAPTWRYNHVVSLAC